MGERADLCAVNSSFPPIGAVGSRDSANVMRRVFPVIAEPE
jgi:hypothetical protein